MSTEISKKYSAKLVKDCFRVKQDYYRPVVMFEENNEKFYALQDINNGGTTLFAVSMKEIMEFIGKDYEIVTAVATYETPLSVYARYILPQTIDMWGTTWQNVFEEETELCRNSLERENEDDLDYLAQIRIDLNLLNQTKDKIDEIFEEFKYVRDTIFHEDLAEKSFEDIVKLLPDYKAESSDVVKQINENEYFMISTTYHEDNDGVIYDIDKGYHEYLEVAYIRSYEDAGLSVILAQRHHHFFFKWC